LAIYCKLVGLLVGQVSNLTRQTRSGWKPDLPADPPYKTVRRPGLVKEFADRAVLR